MYLFMHLHMWEMILVLTVYGELVDLSSVKEKVR